MILFWKLYNIIEVKRHSGRTRIFESYENVLFGDFSSSKISSTLKFISELDRSFMLQKTAFTITTGL